MKRIFIAALAAVGLMLSSAMQANAEAIIVVTTQNQVLRARKNITSRFHRQAHPPSAG